MVFCSKSLHLFPKPHCLDQLIERAVAVILIFVIVAGHVESVLIDTDRMGRAVHLGTDVVSQSGKRLDQLRLCLYSGLIGMRDIIGQGTDHGSAGTDALLDFPFPYTKNLRHIHSQFRIFRNFRERTDGQKQSLGDLSPELHGPKAEAFSHNVCLPVAGCPHKLKLLTDRQETVHFKVDRQIHGLELPLVDDALPSQHMRQFDPVSALDRLYLPDALNTC